MHGKDFGVFYEIPVGIEQEAQIPIPRGRCLCNNNPTDVSLEFPNQLQQCYLENLLIKSNDVGFRVSIWSITHQQTIN